MVPSVTRAIHMNSRMRIPCSTTQKWYFVDGNEDKDCEYGEVWVAVGAPLGNVTNNSTASIMLRLVWTIEFQMPALPPDASPLANIIFASAGDYFTDSSGDWKQGKYLAFKWHEGGNIVSFPSAQPKTIYVTQSSIGYYDKDGALKTTTYAVTSEELTEDGLPFIIPMVSKAYAQAWVASPNDQYLTPYFSPGPWIHPSNPPWEKVSSVSHAPDLVLTRKSHVQAPSHGNAVVRTADEAARSTNKVLQGLVGKEKLEPTLPAALKLLSELDYEGLVPGEHALKVLPLIPIGKVSDAPGSSLASSFEVLPGKLGTFQKESPV